MFEFVHSSMNSALIERLPLGFQETLEYVLVHDSGRWKRLFMTDKRKNELSDRKKEELLKEKNEKRSKLRVPVLYDFTILDHFFLSQRDMAVQEWQSYKNQDSSGFSIGGVNETSLITKLTHLNGQPMRRIEFRMRPDHRGMYDRSISLFNYYGSTEGFLDETERLIHVLERDNDFVLSRGLTHQKLAEPLFYIMNLFMQKDVLGNPEYSLVSNGNLCQLPFILNGEKYLATISAWPMVQHSPFFDQMTSSVDINVLNLCRMQRVSFSGMAALTIQRYGFYEGNTRYRVEPENVIKTFGLKN